MSRISPEDDGTYFDTEEGFCFKLDQNNIVGHIHRQEPLKDRVAIEDPRDKLWWSWWRYDTDEEIFEPLLDHAKRIGSVLLRDTPLEEIGTRFDLTHGFTDEDFNELLGGEDGAN